MTLDSLGLLEQPLDERAFPEVWKVLRSGVADGVFPGAVAGVWDVRDPDRIHVGACGQRRVFPRELPTLPMMTDTIFDLASLTKIMATSVLTATLVERRWIRWDTPVQALVPQAQCPGVTLGHLLSHTAGFAAWEPFWERLRARFAPIPVHDVSIRERQGALREMICAAIPEAGPGEKCVYSDLSFLLLGFALEEVTQMPLDQAVRHFVWEPMGLRQAFFRRVTSDAASSRLNFVAATEDCPWRGGVLQGQVHDDNCWAAGGYGGHAGAFGSIRDVLQFARVLLPRSGWRGFVSEETLRASWSRVSSPHGCSRTLGWDTPSGEHPSAGRLFSTSSVGHLGYTGTSLWIDPQAGLAVALLTNRVHPSRENSRIKDFRPLFHNAMRKDLGR